jgi:signal transduction histidine kinase/ABC-type amino acid transport substrate-binding protein
MAFTEPLRSGSESIEIKVGVYNNYPLISTDSAHGGFGLFADILNEAALEHNLRIRYVPISLNEAIPSLNNGNIDLVAAMAYSSQRAEKLLFSKEVAFTNWAVVYARNDKEVKTIVDLHEKTIGLQRGDIHSDALIKTLLQFNIQSILKWYDDYDAMYHALHSKKIDVCVVNKVYGNLTAANANIISTPIIFNPVNLHFMGRHDTQETLSKIDKTILRLKKSNQYTALLNRWLNSSPHTEKVPSWVQTLITILLGSVALLVLFIILLHSLVKSKTKDLQKELHARKKTELKLQQSEAEKTLILKSVDEAVLFIDNNFNILWSNRPVLEKGMQKISTIGTKCYKTYFNYDAPCSFCTYPSRTATLKEHYFEETDSYYKSYINPVFDDHGKSIGFVKTVSDITEKKRIEQDLVKSKEKAEEADQLKSAFLANMSHEIRTPMNAIIGFSELLNDNNLNDTEKKDYISIIQSNGQQLLSLVSDILVFSQIESGQIIIQKKDIDLHDFLTELHQQFQEETRRLSKPAIEVLLELPKDLKNTSIHTDPTRLKQILSNLLSNAIKFTNQGYVKLQLSQQQSAFQFMVTDTGIGIPKEKLSSIFNRFSQADNHRTRKTGGAGLGLSISKELTLLLGGEMFVESQLGTGSSFWLTIPNK